LLKKISTPELKRLVLRYEDKWDQGHSRVSVAVLTGEAMYESEKKRGQSVDDRPVDNQSQKIERVEESISSLSFCFFRLVQA